MKPFKLLACLVTLQFTSGLTLQAADPQPFRQWTDVNGRAITARFIEAPDTQSVKIERQDGATFTAALTLFSAVDQNYVKAVLAAKATGGPVLLDPEAATWTLLNASNQPAATYQDTRLELILETVNQRFAALGVKTAGGQALQVRTEPEDLAERIKVTGDMPRMFFGTFIKEIARANKLTIKTDLAGGIVLADLGTPATAENPDIEFLGVKAPQK